MSRHELAERVNAWVFDSTREIVNLDAHYIAKLERGVIRWPRAAYREALRAVLGAATNLELGLRPRRTGESDPRPATPFSARSPIAEQPLLHRPGPPARFRSERDSPSFDPDPAPIFHESNMATAGRASRPATDGGLAALVAESVAESVALGRHQEASDLGPATLEQIDLAAAQFSLDYPRVPPGELFPAVRDYRRWATGFLDGRLTLTQRSRLCRVAGWLSGLLGRLSLDLGNRTAASAHCLTAAQLAAETGDRELAEWVRDTRAMIDARPDPADGAAPDHRARPPAAPAPGPPWRPAAPTCSFATSSTGPTTNTTPTPRSTAGSAGVTPVGDHAGRGVVDARAVRFRATPER